jgi:short-subunit dehydrogenase
MIFEKTALVTGCGSKIAKYILQKINNNYSTIKHKLTPEEGYLSADLTNEVSAKLLFDSIKFNLDLIVCCVGGIKLSNKIRPKPDDCLNINYLDAKTIFDKNFFTTFLTCKYGLKKLKKNGNIIIIGSSVVSNPRKNGEVGMYACAKSAVHEYTLQLEKQLEKTNIGVKCIATDGMDFTEIDNCLIEIMEKK